MDGSLSDSHDLDYRSEFDRQDQEIMDRARARAQRRAQQAVSQNAGGTPDGVPSEGAPPSSTEVEPSGEDPGVLGTLGDVITQIPAGMADAASNALNVPIETLEALGLNEEGGFRFGLGNLFPEAETGLGSFTRGTSQFLTGCLPALRATKFIRAGLQARKGLASAKLGGALGNVAVEGAVAGAIADYAVFDPHEARFSDLARELGGPFDNFLTQFLSTDEDDTEFEGRAKNVME